MQKHGPVNQVTNYFQQASKARAMFLAGLAAVGALTLTGCDDGPECLHGHTEITLMPVFNGKTTTLVPVSNFECDEYAKETPSAKA
jgi:hypothetical protein